MKPWLTTLLVLLASFCYSQAPDFPIDSTTGKITYTGIVNADSLSQSQLYSAAREWVAKAFVSAQDVIQMDDEAAGKIVGKGLIRVTRKAMGSIYPMGYFRFTISIYVKNSRYKYLLTDFVHQAEITAPAGTANGGPAESMIHTKNKYMGFSYQKEYDKYLQQLDENVKLLIIDLRKAMDSLQKQDW